MRSWKYRSIPEDAQKFETIQGNWKESKLANMCHMESF